MTAVSFEHELGTARGTASRRNRCWWHALRAHTAQKSMKLEIAIFDGRLREIWLCSLDRSYRLATWVVLLPFSGLTRRDLGVRADPVSGFKIGIFGSEFSGFWVDTLVLKDTELDGAPAGSQNTRARSACVPRTSVALISTKR